MSKNLKHVKLFEQFSYPEKRSVNNTGNLVIGILSEGCDVAVFPAAEGEEIWNHLSSIKSEYYFPFKIVMSEVPDAREKYYLLVNAGGIVEIQEHHPHTQAGGVDVSIVSEYDLSMLAGNETPLSIYNAVGPESEISDIDSTETYALELVEGDQYMSAQSNGVELKQGAYEAFMSYADDEIDVVE